MIWKVFIAFAKLRSLNFRTLVCTMASSSQLAKEKTTFEVQLISNEFKQPKFKAILDVAYKNDLASALSMIPSKVVMIQDVQKC